MLEYLFPVTFLFYFAFSTHHPLSKSKKRYWLFLPFIAAALINTMIDLEVEFGLIDIGLKANESLIETYYFWEYLGTVAFTISMSIWSFLLIRSYQPKTDLAYRKQWFFQFWLFANVLILFWTLDVITDIYASLDLLNYLFAGICFLFFWVSYRGIYQFRLAEQKIEIRAILNQKEPVLAQEESPLIQSLPENLYIERFIKLMRREHLYRDPELSRDIIAERLGISSGYFSQIFSQYFTTNLSEYINELKVGDVKRMIQDEAFQQYSLIAIGFEAGFSSKSSFYSVFKRITGLTPAAYKKQTQESKEKILN